MTISSITTGTVATVAALTFLCGDCRCWVRGLTVQPGNTQKWSQRIAVGYKRRVTADPTFPLKSIAEGLLAASTQFAAEVHARGISNLLPQADFVVPAILTAIAGKYISMWKTAPTQLSSNENVTTVSDLTKVFTMEPKLFQMIVPTNAFQKTMLDGTTIPTYSQRIGSLIVPMAPLFCAGCIASFLGYGFAAAMIQLRTWLLPSYQPQTQAVNVIFASVYTGAFMAVASNLRYQLLQGIVEPTVNRLFHRVVGVRAGLILAIRVCNGMLGSTLAIAGMKLLCIQRLTI